TPVGPARELAPATEQRPEHAPVFGGEEVEAAPAPLVSVPLGAGDRIEVMAPDAGILQPAQPLEIAAAGRLQQPEERAQAGEGGQLRGGLGLLGKFVPEEAGHLARARQPHGLAGELRAQRAGGAGVLEDEVPREFDLRQTQGGAAKARSLRAALRDVVLEPW